MNIFTRFLSEDEAYFVYTHYLQEHFPSAEVKPWKNISQMWADNSYFVIGIFEDTNDNVLPGSAVPGASASSAAVPDASTPGTANSTVAAALRGYAFFAEAPNCDACLLDYFAILPEYRSFGLGGCSLRLFSDLIGQKGKYLLFETEDIDFAKTDSERKTRTRRDSFYARNGCCLTDTKGTVFDQRYAVWVLPAPQETPGAISFGLADSGRSEAALFAPSEEALTKVCSDLQALYRHMVPGEKFNRFVDIRRVS